jgi:gliding motility-associated lipoprotein GldH
MKGTRLLLTMLITSGLLCACQENSYYHRSEVPPSTGWEMNRTLYFQDSLRENTPELLHMEVELRHNNLYPYQNLWLYLRTRTSDGTDRLDSINWTLAEPSGKWLGNGWGSLYSLSYRLPDLKIRKTKGSKWFVVEMQHGLKDPVLEGVESLGLHLFTDN